MPVKLCEIADCDNAVQARGWCGKHYRRWRIHGSPHRVLQPVGMTVEERFWSKVNLLDESGCWIWTAGKFSDGYGCFGITNRKAVGAHRFAFELLVAPIPDDLTIDHLCRVPACVNPSHMEVVTNSENVRRRWEYWRGSVAYAAQ